MAEKINEKAEETLKTFTETSKVVEKFNTSLEKTFDILKQISTIAKEASESMTPEQSNKLSQALDLATASGESLGKVLNNLGKEVAPKLESAADSTKVLTENLSGMTNEVDAVMSKASFDELRTEILGVVAGTRSLHSVWRVVSRFVGSKWGVALAASIGAISGLRQGLTNVSALLSGMGGLLKSAAKGIASFAASIISIPFKLLTLLFDVAESGPMGTELLQAIEDLRKEFGSLRGEVNKTIYKMSKEMDGFKQTGLSTWRVFGMLHERLNYFRELLKPMGFAFDAIKKEILDTEGALIAYQKALAMTGEDMQGITHFAVSMGRSFEDTVNEITKHTLAFSGGVIDKRFSRQVVKAIQDVKHFGGATVKEIAGAAEYAKGLRVELEKIVGVLDAFETFDSAAENASKLAQSFGVTVDAFKMVEAQDPAKQIDMLRKSFFAAGKSAEGFNRQQLKLLSETTGLDESTARLVFSQKNQGRSLEDIQKQAAAAEKKQLSQADAMGKVADAIERLVKQGQKLKGGLFKQFMDGFGRGISISREFRKVMMNVRMSLRQARLSGIKLGRTFLKEFPGLHDVAKNLAKLYNPKQIRKFFDDISVILRGFFKNLTSKTGPESFRQLMTDLKKHFFNWFDMKESEGKSLLEGLQTFFKSFAKILAGAVHYIMTEMAGAFNQIADVLKHPEGLVEGVKKAATGTGGWVFEMVQPIIEALVDAWPMFYDALKNLLVEAWGAAVRFVKKTPEIKNALLTLGTVVFAPIVVRTLVSMLGAVLVGVFKGGFETALKNPSKAKKILSVVTKFFSGTVGKVLASAFAVAFVAALSVGIAEGVNKYKSQILGSFTDAEKTIAAGAAGIIDGLTMGLIPESLMVKVAKFFADLVVKVKKGLNSLLGGLGDDIIDYYASFMKMFSGIGNILIGLFGGDDAKLEKGIIDLLEGLFSTVFNYFKAFFFKLPLLVAKLAIRAVTVIYASIVDIAASVLEKLGLKKTAEFLRGAADGIRDAGKMFSKVFDVVSIVINKVVSAIGGAFSFLEKIFSDSGTAGGIINFLDEKFAGTFKKISLVITAVLEGLEGKTNSRLGKIVFIISQLLKWFVGEVIKFAESIVSMWTWTFDQVMFVGKKLWSGIKWVYNSIAGILSDNNTVFGQILSVFVETIGGPLYNIIEIIGKFLSKVGDLLNIDAIFKNLGGTGKVSPEVLEKIEKTSRSAAGDATSAAQRGFEDSSSSKPAFKLDKLMNIDPESLKNMDIGEMGQVTGAITDVKKMQDSLKSITNETLDEMTQKIDELFGPGGGMITLVDALNQVPTNDIKAASSTMQAYQSLVSSSAEVMKQGGIGQVFAAVNDMVKATNDVDESLSKIGKINVIARLKSVANNIGLGGKMKYTIKSKDVVINLDLKVVMEADKVEKVIIQRKKSVIRNRLINAEYDEDKTKGQNTDIPTTGIIPPIGNGYV